MGETYSHDIPIFDAQVNMGKAAIGPDCGLAAYLKQIPLQVTDVLFIPSPTHVLERGEEGIETSCLWRVESSGKIVYEISVPGVHDIENVLINQLENSIEIKAISDKKVYSKTLNINLPIIGYNLNQGNLVLELAAK